MESKSRVLTPPISRNQSSHQSRYWERTKLQTAGGGRRLGLVDFMQDMGEWILADPTATNMPECAEYVAAAGNTGLFKHESEHASFQIMTPIGTIRLSHGRLHQLAIRDPTDQFDIPDHLTWQMNLAIDHHDVSLEATGVLGETVVPTVDASGEYIMKGLDAIRGSQEHCEWHRVGVVVWKARGILANRVELERRKLSF